MLNAALAKEKARFDVQFRRELKRYQKAFRAQNNVWVTHEHNRNEETTGPIIRDLYWAKSSGNW